MEDLNLSTAVKILMDPLDLQPLFIQPEGTHLGECPLCFFPLPIDESKSMFLTCCSEVICQGCILANVKSNMNDEMRCPFCREVADDDEDEKRLMKRVKANDPAALSHMGAKRHDDGDYDVAFEYLSKAAEFGDIQAQFRLGLMYRDGEGVEEEEEKAVYHFEKASIGGHPVARCNLALFEGGNGNIERAVKHFFIAANLGHEGSMKALWAHYSGGYITKEDLEATLRKHQAAIDAMKSPEREAAEVMFKGL